MFEWISQLTVWFAALSSLNKFFVGIAVSMIGAKIVEVVGIKIVKQFVMSTDTDIDYVLFEDLHSPLYMTIAFGGIYQSTKFLTLPETFSFATKGILLSILVIIWISTLNRIGKRVFKRTHGFASLDKTFIPMFENIWTIVVIVGGVFIFLKIWGINVTPLLASAGIAGVAIGFAAKDAVANFFGGLALYFDDTYRVGDFVVLNNGQAGTVTDIGIRSTTILTRDDIGITVPNAVLNSTHVINESRPEGKLRVKVPVGIAYGSDIDVVEDVLLDVARQNDAVMDDPEPRVRFREFGGSALQYELLGWVSQPDDAPKARHELHRSVYNSLREKDITIPFPQRDVHLLREEDGNDDGESSE